MHAGSIHNPNSAAGRVYRHLKKRRCWIGGWDLTMAAKVSAVSTRISEARRQLPAGEVIQKKQRGGKFYYRWSKAA